MVRVSMVPPPNRPATPNLLGGAGVVETRPSVFKVVTLARKLRRRKLKGRQLLLCAVATELAARASSRTVIPTPQSLLSVIGEGVLRTNGGSMLDNLLNFQTT